MQRSLGLLLFVLMLILALAIVSIVAAAAREGNVAPGAPVPAARRPRARFAAVTATFVVAAILALGGLWWRADARQYASHIYNPPAVEAAISPNGQLVLRAGTTHIASGNPRRPADVIDFNDLILDHEHLMHLFLIRSPGMDVFWHLHPERAGSNSFIQNLPPTPAGHYQIFADVVLSSGFPVTMIGQLNLPSAIEGKPLRGDDSGIAGPSAGSEADTAAEFSFPDESRIVWDREAQPLQAGVPLILHFRVTDRSGRPAPDLEPYMGMPAHAAIVSSDGSVFAHIHPTGSVPMASFELAQASLPSTFNPGGLAPMNMPQMTADKIAPDISIPYGFPKPGLYRMFIQVKRSGQIQTAVFQAMVR